MVRLAAVFTVFFIACSSFPDEVPPNDEKRKENAISPSGSAQLPPSSNPKSGTTSTAGDASPPSETANANGKDASASDATTSAVDASMKDSSTSPPKIAFGQPCTDHAQCAGGICLPFDGKGLRCTKVCKQDSDCPSNDCKDDPEVCDVD